MGETYFDCEQVEHPITEAVHPGLDLVEMMIAQGIAQRSDARGLDSTAHSMTQAIYDKNLAESRVHAIEARVYCENPSEGFKPSPGILQLVDLPEEDWLRIDNWVCILVGIKHAASNADRAGVDGNGSDTIFRSSNMQVNRDWSYPRASSFQNGSSIERLQSLWSAK